MEIASIAALLVLKLSPGIAKAVLKLWLRDREIAQVVGTDLIDMLKAKTGDILAQNAGRRQFEAIGEKVAVSLAPLFIGFNKSQIKMVGAFAGKSIQDILITREILLEKNLDPVRLAEHIKANASPPFELKDEAMALYERVIAEAAQQIVDVASSLPGFTENTFAEILKRESNIQITVDKILDEVEVIRKQSIEKNPLAQTAQFEADYRRSIVRQLDYVQIFGVDLSRMSKRQRLSVAYISLSVEGSVQDYAADELEPFQRENIPEEGEAGECILPVERALAQGKRLLVRGDPGSGKTTLLQWIAVQSAQSTFTGELMAWNETVPFFVRLRQLAGKELPAPEAIPALMTASIAGQMPAGWVHQQLEGGRAIVLVDGVDEVPEVDREKIRRWVCDLVASYPEARFIVTARPYAVDEGWIAEEGFKEAELQSMELPEINSFVDHWHEAVRNALEDQDEIDKLPELADNLKEIMKDRRSPVRKLATSPLLCGMICAMHRDRRRQLPQDRIEIYEAGCNMLLERRDVERGLSLEDYPVLRYRQKVLLLQDLAYWLMKNNWSEVEIAAAAHRFSRLLPNLPNISDDVTGEDVARLFVERSGIVRELVKGHLDFAHRTFQEFLAAKSALDEEDIGFLLENAVNDQWHEVIILAAGIASAKQREKLVGGLIERGDKSKPIRHKMFLLAAGCLEVSVELSANTKGDIVKRLEKIIPPRNITEAKLLAGVGDLATPLLKYGRWDAKRTAACVRSLVTIGTENALEMLKRYAIDLRETVRRELVRGCEFFEPEQQYAQIVLGNWKRLLIERASDLGFVNHLPILESVTAVDAYQIEPGTFSQCPRLKHVYLHNYGGSLDCHIVEALPAIERLEVSAGYRNSYEVLFLDALAKCPRFRELHLRGAYIHEGRTGLRKIKQLETLVIRWRPLDMRLLLGRDVKPRTPMASTDLWEDIRQLRRLKLLSMSVPISTKLLTVLEPLKSLEILELTCEDPELDMRSLPKLPNLKVLAISNGWSSTVILPPESKIPEVREVYINTLVNGMDLVKLRSLAKSRRVMIGRAGKDVKVPEDLRKLFDNSGRRFYKRGYMYIPPRPIIL